MRDRLLLELADRRFEPFLKQPALLATLFLFLGDEGLPIRLAALRLLGRLAPLNHAAILPRLRLFLVRTPGTSDVFLLKIKQCN